MNEEGEECSGFVWIEVGGQRWKAGVGEDGLPIITDEILEEPTW